MFGVKKKNAMFRRYPSCDLLNNALRHIHNGEIEDAYIEIVLAIEKADGYFHDDVVLQAKKAREKLNEKTL